jgi:hypothetical protein
MQSGVGSAANQVFVRWCEIKQARLQDTCKTKNSIMLSAFLQTTGKGKTSAHFSFNKYHLKLASLSYKQAGFPATVISCFVSISFYLTNTLHQMLDVSMETHI